MMTLAMLTHQVFLGRAGMLCLLLAVCLSRCVSRADTDSALYSRRVRTMTFSFSPTIPADKRDNLRMLQIARITNGSRLAWATLNNDGEVSVAETFNATFGTRSFEVDGSLSSTPHLSLTIIEMDISLDLNHFGTFHCSIVYFPDTRVNDSVVLVPGMTLPVKTEGGCEIGKGTEMDMLCLTKIKPGQSYAVSITDALGTDVVASWNTSRPSRCERDVKVAACGPLQTSHNLLIAKARLKSFRTDKNYVCRVTSKGVVILSNMAGFDKCGNKCALICGLTALFLFIIAVAGVVVFCLHRRQTSRELRKGGDSTELETTPAMV